MLQRPCTDKAEAYENTPKQGQKEGRYLQTGRRQTMTIREITEQDLPVLAGLYAQTFNAPPWNDRWTPDTAGRRLALMLAAPGALGLAAWDGAAPLGLALGVEEQYFDGAMFNLREFCVALAHRGRGVGTALLKTLEERLAQNGVGEISLFTGMGEEGEDFYRGRGFTRYEGMVMMGKPL